MAESDQGEKTEEPTQTRREDFRKRGQVAQSKELVSVLILATGLLCIWMMGSFFLQQIHQVFSASFTDYLIPTGMEMGWVPAAKFAVTKAAMIVGPILGIMWVVSFMSSVVQIGFLVNEEAMQFKFERLDPMQGLQRVFSLKSLIEGLKAIFKLIIVAGIAALVVRSEIFKVPLLIHFKVEQLFVYMGSLFFKLIGGVGFFMAILAALDFFFQKWDLEKKMRMTKQEVKEEMKSREGDPLVKARVRRVQREIAQRRMMEDVPKADVVITNPTHIAVALRYSAEMIAPTIVAKGAGVVAEKIKELAREHNVPLVENKPLARTMFRTLKIGQVIPRELYTAVAEVLSYIFKLKKKKGVTHG